MSSLQVDNIQTYNSNPPVIKNVNGAQVGTFCRAWVNFNGTGTVAIRQSFNVSSITDNGVGDYTVNFTTAMPDADYSVCCMNAYDATGGSWPAIFTGLGRYALSTSSYRIQNGAGNSTTLFDSLVVVTAVFR